MPPLGFEPTISGSERPQTHALDRAETGIVIFIPSLREYYKLTLITQCKHLLHALIALYDIQQKLLSSSKAGKMKQLCFT
jgi:hypothetical protein